MKSRRETGGVAMTPEEAMQKEPAYWLQASVEERIAAVELMRRATPGIYDDPDVRMERVLRFVDRDGRELE